MGLVTLRRHDNAEFSLGVCEHWETMNYAAPNPGDEDFGVLSFSSDADGVALLRLSVISDVDVVAAGC